MTSVPEGFSNRQGVDIGIIGKYGREYLKTVFPKVYTVKGSTTAEFRKMWGLQPEYAKKERVNHTHHCIDAITIACIGNGVSMIIMIGIIARMPSALGEEFLSAWTSAEGGGLVKFLFEIIALLFVMALAIILVKAVRKVPVQYAKRIEGGHQIGGARQYIPVKLFAANVMPIIFAQAIMFIPLTLAQMSGSHSWAMSQFLDHTSVLYNVVFVILIIAFTYFYTAITLNPVQMAEDMKRNNGFIPGVKPGKDTADYLDNVMTHITLPGSLFIALIAILPAFAGIIGIKQGFAQFFGGTSLLILVGVVLDTLQQIESHLLVRHYDGLLNAGHVRNRA